MMNTWNAININSFGLEAKKFLEEGRQAIATALGAETSREIIFTSGGSESNNLAIKVIDVWIQLHSIDDTCCRVSCTRTNHAAIT